MQDGDAAVKSGLGLLAAAVATLALSAYVAKEEASPPKAGGVDAKPPAKSGWTPLRILGRIVDLAEGVLFSFALGMAGGHDLYSC